MMQSDWSQLIPDIIAGLIIAMLIALFAYFKSERFKNWLNKLWNKILPALKWLIGKWQLILLLCIIAFLEWFTIRIYENWQITVFSFIWLGTGVFSYWWLTHSLLKAKTKRFDKYKPKFLPISLAPGIGNLYFENRYLDPPLGDDVVLEGLEFQLQLKSLIFDTNEQFRSYLPIADGSKEVNIRLPENINHIKSVHCLINSSNSKNIYASEKVGEIRLLFKDAPPIVTDLILGVNIREWCPGNIGDFVRETSSPYTKVVWKGMSKQGASAIIDCLTIPVFECMKSNFLEQIAFRYKPTQRPPDTMGVHFTIYAISLRIE
jgi:hypothetical protein